MDGRIENERMNAAVPCQVHEAYQALAVKGADMAEAPLQDLCVAGASLTPPSTDEVAECVLSGPGIDPDIDGWGAPRLSQSWLNIVAAPVAWMPLPPSGSKFRVFTTPSSTSMENRFTRVPMPEPERSIASPSALA